MKQNLIFFFFHNFRFLIKKFSSIKKNLLIFLLNILIGMILGSIFGTLLPFFRNFLFWDGFIFIFILFFSEIISALIYSNLKTNSRFYVSLNWVKIGFFLGFFIDAFKVGS